MRGRSGGEAWSSQLDALEEGALEALTAEIVSRHGRLDVFHNLTSTTVLAPSVELTLAHFARVFEATVRSPSSPARRRPRAR